MTPPNPENIHYHSIDPDYGGTYTHRPSSVSDNDLDIPETLPAIRTHGCVTCVGVYFQLSANTCFVAHINVTYIKDSDDAADDDDENAIDYRMLTPSEGELVHQEMIRRFKEKAIAISGRLSSKSPTSSSSVLTCTIPSLARR